MAAVIDELGICERGVDERGICERGVCERGVDEWGRCERGICEWEVPFKQTHTRTHTLPDVPFR